MTHIRQSAKELVADALNILAKNMNVSCDTISADAVTVEIPPNPDLGDLGIPLFMFAKTLRLGPPQIGAKLSAIIAEQMPEKAAHIGVFSVAGPYINIKLNKAGVAASVLGSISEQGAAYGAIGQDGNKPMAGKRVMVEFSSPNTNKPLHLGHLRNDALGESVSRILALGGAEVYKVNIINNRGVHICKSMLAYSMNHEGDTPESLGIKSDRFVGDCYVEFEKYRRENEAQAEAEAQNLLVEWEKGNPEVHALWQKMNDWAISGILQTYKRTGISFDKFYYESETYLKGKEEVLAGLEKGVFYREDDGSVWIDLAEINLDKKVLLRKDGTALYMTQDIGTAIHRHGDWPFNQLVYVVGNEQNYHFKVLFYVLKKLGYDWADQLYHLSYGMVNLPEGKMKSREGTVVDADDLISQLRDGALEEIAAKGREEAVGDPAAVAENIALGALHYFLLQTTPAKDMLFNPKESLSFNGNTGPYLQYMGARISSILRKAQELKLETSLDLEKISQLSALLEHPAEWELLKTLGDFPQVVKKAAETLNPAEIATYLYDVAKQFSSFYHECPILTADNADLVLIRLHLASCVKIVLQNAMYLILVPFLETM